MKFYLSKLLQGYLGPSEKEGGKFVFRQAQPVAAGGGATVPQEDETEEEEEERETREEQLRQRQNRQQMLQHQVDEAAVGMETKRRMREALFSGLIERQNLVERFLDKEERLSEQEFIRQLEAFEQEDHSWREIFNVQRDVRKKIQELQWKTESYIELVPRHKKSFEGLLKQVRKLNGQDDRVDRNLKHALQPLFDPPQGQAAVLTREDAHKIYLLDPLKEDFWRTMNGYAAQLRPINGGRVFRTLMALKQEEANTERTFKGLYDDIDKLLQSNISKARRKMEQNQLLKEAGRSIGITIKEGTEIEYSDPDLLSAFSPKQTAKIARITWEAVELYDKDGNVIDRRNGFPHIHLNDGSKFTIGRFKKWVDGANAVEKISNLEEVNEACGLKKYGIEIQEEMMLEYPLRKTDSHGSIHAVPAYVTITKIDETGKMIYLSSAVPFQPGLGQDGDTEMKTSLTFGEFVKWWHRYEVEKTLSLQELRKLLRIHNEFENKEFGIESDDNPQILVEVGEDLHYPDEFGAKFAISSVMPDGVLLDTGTKFTFPEFFYWVKNNHVEKMPYKATPKEVAERKAKEDEIDASQVHAKVEKEHKIHAGEQQHQRVEKFKQDMAAGTFLGKAKEIFWTTQILSLVDLWNMTLEIVEFIKRKHERRSKGRYGEIGSRLPWVVGTEFERVKQAAENEEVNKYKEPMEQWSIEKVKRTLHETTSKDEAKACITTLVHKGEMRWDDHEFWQMLNILTSRYTMRGAELYIPDHEHMPPGEHGEDLCMKSMNALWGDGTAQEWFAENTNKYNSMKNNFEFKFKQLENDPQGTGGPAGACKKMLQMWRKGEYVNPQEYEEMIDGAIKYGKMIPEEKMFYLLAGVIARQGDQENGETLLHVDRLGEMDSKYLNQFPLLDFFTQRRVMDYSIYNKEKKQWGVSRKLNISDYQKWARERFPNEFRDCKPGPRFSQFLWEVMMTDEMVRTRISKGLRRAEEMDHDDAQLFIPPAAPTEVDNLTTGPSGQKKYFTNSGYANGYAGFNQWIIGTRYTYEEETDPEIKKHKLYAVRDALNSFIRYDAILDNRFLREEGDRRARLDARHYERPCVVDDSCIMRLHQVQMRNLIMEVGREYGENWEWLYGARFGYDKDGKLKQKEYERKIQELKEKIEDLIESDGGEKALRVIRRAQSRDDDSENGLRGIKASRRPTAEDLAETAEEARRNPLPEVYLKSGH